MKKIAITQRIEAFESVGEIRDTLDVRLIQLVVDCDLCPVPIPNFSPAGNILEHWLDCIRPDGILFSGGQDFGLFSNRDNLENSLLSYANSKRLPTLGICRGMQLLIKHAGGSLKKVIGHVNQGHKLKGAHNHFVECYHDFAPDLIPDEYQIISRAADNCVEAIRHKSLPVEGWMWHPERTMSNRDLHIQLIKQVLGS